MPDKHWFFRQRGSKALAHRAKEAEVVSDEPTDIFASNEYIAEIRARSPNDAKYLHPGEIQGQRKYALKYFRNPIAKQLFIDVMEASDADEAYVYFPLGASEPNVWFIKERYTIPKFEETFGVIESGNPRMIESE